MEARAIQRTVRQSARKMRLVIDQIRGQAVPQAYAILRFSKKLAAKQIHKVLKSAVANAEQRALRENTALDVHQPRRDPRGRGRGVPRAQGLCKDGREDGSPSPARKGRVGKGQTGQSQG